MSALLCGVWQLCSFSSVQGESGNAATEALLERAQKEREIIDARKAGGGAANERRVRVIKYLS